MGKILSTGIIGNKKDVIESNPFIAKNKEGIIIYLFIVYNDYIILYCILMNAYPKKDQEFCYLIDG
jgi:hypothetical protein